MYYCILSQTYSMAVSILRQYGRCTGYLRLRARVIVTSAFPRFARVLAESVTDTAGTGLFTGSENGWEIY